MCLFPSPLVEPPRHFSVFVRSWHSRTPFLHSCLFMSRNEAKKWHGISFCDLFRMLVYAAVFSLLDDTMFSFLLKSNQNLSHMLYLLVLRLRHRYYHNCHHDHLFYQIDNWTHSWNRLKCFSTDALFVCLCVVLFICLFVLFCIHVCFLDRDVTSAVK